MVEPAPGAGQAIGPLQAGYAGFDALLSDDDVATLKPLAGDGMGTLDYLQAVDLAFRLELPGPEALNLPMETAEHRAAQTIVGDAAGRWRGPVGPVGSQN